MPCGLPPLTGPCRAPSLGPPDSEPLPTMFPPGIFRCYSRPTVRSTPHKGRRGRPHSADCAEQASRRVPSPAVALEADKRQDRLSLPGCHEGLPSLGSADRHDGRLPGRLADASDALPDGRRTLPPATSAARPAGIRCQGVQLLGGFRFKSIRWPGLPAALSSGVVPIVRNSARRTPFRCPSAEGDTPAGPRVGRGIAVSFSAQPPVAGLRRPRGRWRTDRSAPRRVGGLRLQRGLATARP
jgi:hypothetical protein